MNNESYGAFIARVKEMKSGEIIDKGDNLNGMFFLKKSLEYNGIETRLELESEGTPLDRKVLVIYKA